MRNFFGLPPSAARRRSFGINAEQPIQANRDKWSLLSRWLWGFAILQELPYKGTYDELYQIGNRKEHEVLDAGVNHFIKIPFG
jgi:hypothetical protein